VVVAAALVVVVGTDVDVEPGGVADTTVVEVEVSAPGVESQAEANSATTSTTEIRVQRCTNPPRIGTAGG